MIGLVKLIIRTGPKNNGELFLRLRRNADRVRYINYLSKRILDKKKTIHKEQFNRIISIRTYEQLSEKKVLSSETDPSVYENSTLHTDKNNKMFTSLEKDYARKFLLSSRHYDKTLVQPNKFSVTVTDEEALEILNKDWSIAETSELIGALRKLSYNITSNNMNLSIEKQKYRNIFNTLNERISYLDDKYLEETLQCLLLLHGHFKLYLQKTVELLDKECVRRIPKWNTDKLLLMSDLFYLLFMQNKSDFVWRSMRKLGSKPNKLTSKNLIQLLFLISITRKSNINMYEIEVRLEESLDDLSINELGIAAMGFFKSKTTIKNSLLLKNIINRLICDIEQVDSVALAALIKLIRYSMQYNEIVHFRMLLNKILLITDRLNLMCLVHIGQCLSKACIFEESLVNVIIERMNNEIKNARIKDIERFTFMLSTFDIDATHPIFDTILKEIDIRININPMQEVFKYADVFLNLLYYLSVKDIYSIDMLKKIMNLVDFNQKWKQNPHLLGHNISILEASVKIDRPEYTGPFLSENIYKGLTKRHWKQANDKGPSQMTRMFNEIIYVFKEYVSSDVNLYIGKLLPHYLTNDIVFGIDQNRNLISAKSILSELCEFNAKKVDDTFPKNVKWVALLIIHYNHKIRGSNEVIGLVKAKMRQLQRIGYIPILISDDDWLKNKTLKEKGDYLKHLLAKV